MRLTSELIESAPQELNCNGDRSLILRSHGIPTIENLAVARDRYDLIDLSGNGITLLGEGFPPFARLKILLLGSNQIRAIGKGLAASLPNLQTLVLSENRIETLESLNLEELSKLFHLKVLGLNNNPVARVKNFRLQLLKHIPSLRYINFVRVRRAEREASARIYGPPIIRASKRRKNSHPSPTKEMSMKKLKISNGKAGKMKKESKKKNLSAKELGKIRSLIAKAKTVEEVTKVQRALQSGNARELLKEKGKRK